jgi:hypothetical protein
MNADVINMDGMFGGDVFCENRPCGRDALGVACLVCPAFAFLLALRNTVKI